MHAGMDISYNLKSQTNALMFELQTVLKSGFAPFKQARATSFCALASVPMCPEVFEAFFEDIYLLLYIIYMYHLCLDDLARCWQAGVTLRDKMFLLIFHKNAYSHTQVFLHLFSAFLPAEMTARSLLAGAIGRREC